jgi:hypothetical protein
MKHVTSSRQSAREGLIQINFPELFAGCSAMHDLVLCRP